jgi:hypothetical protein
LQILEDTGKILVFPVLCTSIVVPVSRPAASYYPYFCNTRRYWSLPKYEYCRYRKILGNTGNTSIANTGRFWKILVIPVLQILEDSGKYW